jgi:Trk K+ transport system NAD-binding subunit
MLFFSMALTGLLMGVSLSERPSIDSANILTKAYYSLGLFVFGGLDLGTPQGGPFIGKVFLWIAYFGSPILTASALIEAIINVITPHNWRLHSIKNHIVIVGSGELTITYLKALREVDKQVPVVIIDSHVDPLREHELKAQFSAKVIVGDITHSYVINQLNLAKARKVLMLIEDNFQSYDAANKILKRHPNLVNKVIIHCNSIRFMRSMSGSNVAKSCITFNSYQLAAIGLTNGHLMNHFLKTKPKDVVVIAGFGLFGQSVLEELSQYAKKEIDTVAIISKDAHRRVLVVDEQLKLSAFTKREILEGDISHPEMWDKLCQNVDLTNSEPIIILGTGSAEENLRASIWLREKYPKALIIARSHQPSQFAQEIGQQYGINSISITQLVKENFPKDWLIS